MGQIEYQVSTNGDTLATKAMRFRVYCRSTYLIQFVKEI